MILAFGFLLLFALWIKVRAFCRGADWQICEDPRGFMLYWLPKAAALVLALYLIRWLRQPRFRNVSASSDFANNPAKYHGNTIHLIGRIEYIVPDTFAEKVKRKVTDIYRTAAESDDHTNRYVHQRFLISSPQLIEGEKLMVHHNIGHGKLPLKRGAWVTLKGEYLHEPSENRRTGKQNRYGLIHKTHPPGGSAERVVMPETADIEAGVRVT